MMCNTGGVSGLNVAFVSNHCQEKTDSVQALEPRCVQATQDTAAGIALNPKVQVVAPAMHQAFRQADMLNSIYEEPPG